MTTRYTNTEWARFIAEVERDVVESHHHTTPYPRPAIGSAVFARTIDHTLLKLETTAVQIDALCAEARVHGFAVSGLQYYAHHQRNADNERL